MTVLLSLALVYNDERSTWEQEQNLFIIIFFFYPTMPITDKTFIETQFPVSLISKESYKERKAGAGQTLTGLGKWWGA